MKPKKKDKNNKHDAEILKWWNWKNRKNKNEKQPLRSSFRYRTHSRNSLYTLSIVPLHAANLLQALLLLYFPYAW